jgi:predicted ribosomally synthesized peptide with SipW-like signal peptide
MTLMIASVLIGAVTVGTFAQFTDPEDDTDNDITAATVDILLTGGDTHCVVLSLVPGADISWGAGAETDCVTNVANVSVDDPIDVYLKVVLTPVECTAGAPGADDGSQYCDDDADVTGTEVSLDSASFVAPDLLVFGEAYYTKLDLAGVAGLGCVLIGTLAGGADTDFSFDGSLDDVGNTAQGDALTIDLFFEAVLAGDLVAPDCDA